MRGMGRKISDYIFLLKVFHPSSEGINILRLVHTIPSIESKLSTHSFYTLDLILPYSSVQFSHSVMSNSLRPHESQHARPPCPSPSLISHLILCRPLLLLPSIPPSIRVFSNESNLRMRWPKYWSLSFSIIFPKNSQA